MPTQTQINIAINAHTEAVRGVIPCIYDNVDNATLAEGSVSFIKQNVRFLTDKQNELGNTASRRIDGIVLIIIHVRKGTGTAERDAIYDAVVKSFRSLKVGGATFLDPKQVAAGNSENWNLTGWQIPFFFFEP
jgi:hypothetical protein